MAGSMGWMVTAWQGLPRFWRLAVRLRPTFHLPDIRALDNQFIIGQQVSALLWDVDGTLMRHHDTRVAAEFQETLKSLEGRVPQAIISNCGEDRFLELGAIFPQLPVLKAYSLKGGTVVLRCLERGEERWSIGLGTHTRPIPPPEEQLRPVQKPSAELIGLALHQIKAPSPARAFMVGDQYFTDVAGANLAGIQSVKVRTFAPRTFPIPIRLFQVIERGLYRLLHGAAREDPPRG